MLFMILKSCFLEKALPNIFFHKYVGDKNISTASRNVVERKT